MRKSKNHDFAFQLVRCVKRLKLMVCEGELRKLGYGRGKQRKHVMYVGYVRLVRPDEYAPIYECFEDCRELEGMPSLSQLMS